MTDSRVGGDAEPSVSSDAAARLAALRARRGQEPASSAPGDASVASSTPDPSEAAPTGRSPRPPVVRRPRKEGVSPARIIGAAAAVAGGVGLVGVMSATAPQPAPQVVEVQVLTGEATADGVSVSAGAGSAVPVRSVAAQPVTESSGS